MSAVSLPPQPIDAAPRRRNNLVAVGQERTSLHASTLANACTNIPPRLLPEGLGQLCFRQNQRHDRIPLWSAVRYSIGAQNLTDEAFGPYGAIIKPRLSGEQFDRAHSYDPSQEITHVKLVMTNGEPTLRIMHQRLRGLMFSKMARHRRVSQCLGSLQRKEWFMAVAEPTKNDTGPRLEDIAAFRIPGDRIIKLHVATWHAGPHFRHEECLFLNFENEDTNTQDFQEVALPQACQIEIGRHGLFGLTTGPVI